MVVVGQDAVVASVLALVLTLAVGYLVVSQFKHFAELLRVIQLCQIARTARNGVIHHQIVVLLTGRPVHLVVGVDADMVGR